MSSPAHLETSFNIAYDQSNLTPTRPVLRPYAHKGESIIHSLTPLTPPRSPCPAVCDASSTSGPERGG